MHARSSTAERGGDHRNESVHPEADCAQSVHESLEDSLLGIMVAVAHADSSRVAPDLGSQKQKPLAAKA